MAVSEQSDDIWTNIAKIQFVKFNWSRNVDGEEIELGNKKNSQTESNLFTTKNWNEKLQCITQTKFKAAM